jgi:hypothetical protein
MIHSGSVLDHPRPQLAIMAIISSVRLGSAEGYTPFGTPLGPLWDPFGTPLGPSYVLWTTMDHCQCWQRAIRGPFQTCSTSLKPSNPMISMIHSGSGAMDLRWMILDPIDRSIDPRSDTPISTIWGLNLESCWHPSDAVLGVVLW